MKQYMIDVARASLPPSFRGMLYSNVLTPYQRLISGPIKKRANKSKPKRFLEIGPGARRIDGFETLNVVGGLDVDYIGNAAKQLPFADATFDVIYASHIVEHVPWYKSVDMLREWVRVLKPGGKLEIWVPDGLKIARAFVEAEAGQSTDFHQDAWWKFNDEKDPCLWMSGRSFSYGGGDGKQSHPNWHLALFSERHLKNLFAQAGLVDIRPMDRSEVRGHDHGWINLGVTGTKK